MKKNFLTLIFFIVANITFGQVADTVKYYRLIEVADSFYNAGDFKTSSQTYSNAFQAFGWKGYPKDRFAAARAWSLADYPDSALFNLNRIATKSNFSEYFKILLADEFISLHSYTQWDTILTKVRQNRNKKYEKYNLALIDELDSMVVVDQKWRIYSMKYSNGQLHHISVDYETIMKNYQKSDSSNYSRIVKIFSKYGFPNYDLVGKEGSDNFWILVQHQDDYPDFQSKVLKKMKVEVDSGKASGINYAYLVDRVKLNTGAQQIYGTQMQLNDEGTSYTPRDLFEPEKVNDRRKSVGMPPIEEYIKEMNDMYFGRLNTK